MTSKTTNKFSPAVRTARVRLVVDYENDHASRWSAVSSIAARIGCTAQTLYEWVDWFNNRRLLEPIGNIPPAAAEERYYAMPEEPARAA